MQVALYRNCKDPQADTQDLAWDDLAQALTTHDVRTEKDGPAWSPVSLSTPTRKNDHVTAVTVAVFDLDHLSRADADACLTRLEEAGLEFVVHSTHSHTEEDYCLRVILPLARPVPAQEWKAYRAHLESTYGLPADPATKDLARLYYLPAAKPGAPVIGGRVPGKHLDPSVFSSPAPAAKKDEPAPPTPIDVEGIRKRLLGISKQESRELARRALGNEPFAPHGEHDTSLQRLASICAFALPLETPAEAIIAVCETSLRAMGWEDGWDNLVSVFTEKLERARQTKREKDEEDARLREAVRAEAQAAAANQVGDEPGPYTEEQLAQWAAEQGGDLTRRWIIQTAEGNFYIFVAGQYVGPISREAFQTAMVTDLARAPIALTEENAKGKIVRRPVQSLLDAHASVAFSVTASLIRQRSTFDPKTRTFHEAACPIRVFTPKYHPEIQTWLELLAGDKKEKVLDWVASVTKLDRPLCGLYFTGAPGAGKNLFAQAIARLWSTSGPVSFTHFHGAFNEKISKCPIVLADEAVPKDSEITAVLRRLVGSTEMEMRQKFRDGKTLEGSLRLVVTANNEHLFRTTEDLTDHDQNALAARFLKINTPQAAADYLESLGGIAHVDQWRIKDMLAEHALWLRDNRQVKDEGRFMVRGDPEDIVKTIAASDDVRNDILASVAKTLSDPKGDQKKRILAGCGEVWVNAEAFTLEEWKKASTVQMPTVTQLGRKLALLADKQTIRPRISLGADKRQVLFHRIPGQKLLAFAQEHGVGDMDLLIRRVNASECEVAEVLGRSKEVA